MITLTLKEAPSVPLEAESISPDVTATLSNGAIRELPVLLGKRSRRIADFFDVEGEASDTLAIVGDCARVKWIGPRVPSTATRSQDSAMRARSAPLERSRSANTAIVS